jgi:hypothetical protein
MHQKPSTPALGPRPGNLRFCPIRLRPRQTFCKNGFPFSLFTGGGDKSGCPLQIIRRKEIFRHSLFAFARADMTTGAHVFADSRLVNASRIRLSLARCPEFVPIAHPGDATARPCADRHTVLRSNEVLRRGVNRVPHFSIRSL